MYIIPQANHKGVPCNTSTFISCNQRCKFQDHYTEKTRDTVAKDNKHVQQKEHTAKSKQIKLQLAAYDLNVCLHYMKKKRDTVAKDNEHVQQNEHTAKFKRIKLQLVNNNTTGNPLTAVPMVSLTVLPNCPCFYR